MKKSKYTYMLTDRDFHTFLKVDSAKRGMKIVQFQRHLMNIFKEKQNLNLKPIQKNEKKFKIQKPFW